MLNNDTANSNAQQNTPNQSPTTFYESTQMKNNQLLNNIQDRVSNFVLRQIDSQLEKMEKEFEKNIVNLDQLNEHCTTQSSQNAQQEEPPHTTVPPPNVNHRNLTTSISHLSKVSLPVTSDPRNGKPLYYLPKPPFTKRPSQHGQHSHDQNINRVPILQRPQLLTTNSPQMTTRTMNNQPFICHTHMTYNHL